VFEREHVGGTFGVRLDCARAPADTRARAQLIPLVPPPPPPTPTFSHPPCPPPSPFPHTFRSRRTFGPRRCPRCPSRSSSSLPRSSSALFDDGPAPRRRPPRAAPAQFAGATTLSAVVAASMGMWVSTVSPTVASNT
jgi:hypothetical protein